MKNERIWSVDFTFLMISLLLVACANYALTSSIAVYGKAVGGSAAYVGLLTSAFYFGSVGMRLVNGLMVQRHGAHRMMLVGAVLGAAACGLHCFKGLALLLTARIAHGVGFSIFSTASGTAASYLVPRRRMAEGMGYFTIGNVLAMAVGPAFAMAIVTRRTPSEFRLLFLLAAAIGGLALLLTCLMNKRRCDGPGAAKPLPNFVARRLPPTFLGFEKGVILPSLVSFLMTFAYSPVIVYLVGYGLTKGWPNVGLAFTMYALGLLGSRLFTGRLSDRYGQDVIMFPAYGCGIAALLGIAGATAFWQLCLSMVVLGLCVGSYNPQINIFCITRCTKARRGTATAAFNGAGDLGLAVGSVAGGAAIECLGYTLTFILGASICLATLFIYLFTLSGRARRRHLAQAQKKAGPRGPALS